MSLPHIPFVDLSYQTDDVRSDILVRWQELLDSRQFIGGNVVESFEHELARLFDLPYAIGLGNGCDALEIILQALDIGEGDEVVVPSHTFIATSLAVQNVGAIPVVVDIDPATRCIDSDKISAALTERTKAVIPVHLYGDFSDCDSIQSTLSALGSKAVIIEDSAQAQGVNPYASSLANRYVCTSFYPGKNLGAFGDGGAVVTTDERVADLCRKIGNYGSSEKYTHDVRGRNSRLDPLQAIVLSEKIKRLPAWQAQRRQQAEHYNDHLLQVQELKLPEPRASQHWHLYVVQCDERQRLREYLSSHGIETVLHYPYSLGGHPLVKASGRVASSHYGDLLAGTCLSLPLFPGMKESEQARVVDAIYRFYEVT